MNGKNIDTVGEDRATLGSHPSAPTVVYSKGLLPFDAALLNTCYRRQSDRSFFLGMVEPSRFGNGLAILRIRQLIVQKNRLLYASVNSTEKITDASPINDNRDEAGRKCQI